MDEWNGDVVVLVRVRNPHDPHVRHVQGAQVPLPNKSILFDKFFRVIDAAGGEQHFLVDIG